MLHIELCNTVQGAAADCLFIYCIHTDLEHETLIDETPCKNQEKHTRSGQFSELLCGMHHFVLKLQKKHFTKLDTKQPVN